MDTNKKTNSNGDSKMIFDHIKTIEGVGKVGVFIMGTQACKSGTIHPVCDLHDIKTLDHIKRTVINWNSNVEVKPINGVFV